MNEKIDNFLQEYLPNILGGIILVCGIGFVFLIVSLQIKHDELYGNKYGIASYYGAECAGEIMANGQKFNPNNFTCATYEYTLGTHLKVTNLSNNRYVIVTITDRGPNKKLDRVIDLSESAFKEIEQLKFGVAKVELQRID